MSFSLPYNHAPILQDHAPALSALFSHPVARLEWHDLCRTEGVPPSDPAYNDPTADTSAGKKAAQQTIPTGRRCEFCRHPFFPKNESARFCGAACRSAARRERIRRTRP